MKIESCPKCEQIPTFHQSQYSDVTPQTIIACGCGTELQWGGTWTVILRFNRWARRERRRTKKERRDEMR